MEKDRCGNMEYYLPEDDYKEYVDAIRSDMSRKDPDMAMDCVNFEKYTDKDNAIMARDEAKEFQEPQRPISHMLNDEAPDNFLSSAALEKNIFSDDDEYGLRKSNKNLVNPAWVMDLDTEDVVKREPSLGLDYVNFPPPLPACGASDMEQENLSEQSAHKLKSSSDDAEILYETLTDGPAMKREFYESEKALKRLDLNSNPKPSCSKNSHDHDTEESISSIMNDHNYISQTTPIDEYKRLLQNFHKDLRDGKVEIPTDEISECCNEASLIADFLRNRIGQNENYGENKLSFDDDACSNASTIPYLPANEHEDFSQEDDRMSIDDPCDDAQRKRNICKEELIIEESEPLTASGALNKSGAEDLKEVGSRSLSPVDEQQDFKITAVAEIVDLTDSKPGISNAASDAPSLFTDLDREEEQNRHSDDSNHRDSDRSPSRCSSRDGKQSRSVTRSPPLFPPPVPCAVPGTPERYDPIVQGRKNSSASEKSKTEETSSISVVFSENRSEPLEFCDSDYHYCSSPSDNDPKSNKTEKSVTPVAPVLNEPIIAETSDNPKITELKEFARKLIALCDNTKQDENLQEMMDSLLLGLTKIVRTEPTTVEVSVQTEKYISKKKQKKMNEKAKQTLLNEESSDTSSSDDDCDRIEKSPSYSDLSARASSEEFLNTEPDDVATVIGSDRTDNVQSEADGIDLSKYCEESDSNHHTEDDHLTEGDGLDLSKYEENSEQIEKPVEPMHESNEDHVPSESEVHDISDDHVPTENEAKEDAEQSENIAAVDTKETENVDEEMAESKDDGDDKAFEEHISDDDLAESGGNEDDIDDDDEQLDSENDIDDDYDGDDDEASQPPVDMVNEDEKLKVDPVVVVDKLSETELENFYDDIRDKDIEKLLRFSGIVKRSSTETVYTYPDRNRSSKTKKLFEILQDAKNDICSDESCSDVDESIVTEREFLNQCNTNAKEAFLKSISSDSEIDSKISDDENMNNLSDCSLSNDSQPGIVDIFLKKISEKPPDITAEVASVEANAEPEESKTKQDGESIDVSEAVNDEIPKETFCAINAENNISLEDESDLEAIDDELGEGSSSKDTGNKNDETATSVRKVSDSNSTTVNQPKPSTSRGYGLIRSLLEEKEIDIDAISAAGKNDSNTNTIDSDIGDSDILDVSLTRRPASTKSLEMLMEESKRRQNAKSTDNIVTVNVDSDSDLEEISIEPETQTRSIKPMLRKDQLAGETRVAQRRENERIKRLEKKNELLAKMIKESEKDADVTMGEKELFLDYNSESKNLIKVHPEIVRHLKDHQVDGIKFMYDNCYGAVDHLKKHPGSGCILAHCMGLGKTLQLIALLHTVITHKELNTSKILVLCPKSTVMNWADEIRRWLGPLRCNNLKIFSFLDISGIQEKLGTLQEWSCSGKPGYRKAGCLLMGYEAFRILVFYHLYKKKNVSASQVEKIKQKIRETLLEPGADLVICDEGHIIKNRKAATSLAVSEINTPRRIILTGTPIQNNLKEYYAMVNFIKPKFLGTEKEFANLYANPIKNGQHKDSNKRDIKIMKQRSFVLHKKLSKFVQRREAALLKTFLPMKYEYVLFIPMADVQNNLYEFFLEASSKREGSKGKNLIPDYTCLRKIWTHPRVLENAWKNAVQKNRRENKKSPVREPNSDDEVPDDVYDTQTGALSVTDDWWRPLITDDNLKSILPSNKLQTMFEILRMCEENGEKCLIFSAFVAVLDCVEYFMHQINENSQDSRSYGLGMYRGSWVSGKDYYRLDGKTPKTLRHEMVKRFNDPTSPRARVFLISAKAGGQGINLIGANRVIILDTSWNPSNDQQNIFRVFRLGQKRKCYVYRLIAMGTMEEKVYSRSVTKQAMSFRVVDEQQIDRHYSMAELTELYTLTKPDFQNRPVPTLPQDSILASLLRNNPHLVYKYHEHDSLLENKLEQELSEQDKADAWDAYEKDLQYSQNPDFLSTLNSIPQMMQNPGNFMPPGAGYGYPQGRGYGMNYGNIPQGLMAGLGYPSTSSLMDMFNMFSSYPGSNPSIMSPLTQNPGNHSQPYVPGGLPSTSTSLPMNLPAFNTLQSMVQSTGMSTMPSFTSPYSTMAGGSPYNLSDPNLFNLLAQNYVNNSVPMDARTNLGRPPINTPPNSISDKQKSPFPPSLVVPATVAESIPTSVIMKPPQAHALHQQSFAAQLPAQLPPPQQAQPKPQLPQSQVQSKLQHQLQTHTMPKPPTLPLTLPPQQQIQSTSILQNGVAKQPSVVMKYPLQDTFNGGPVQNRNSSPITVTRNSPQPKASVTSPLARGTNMGIVYPDPNAATITPIVTPALPPTTSLASISNTATANTNISVRSVSSINNNSNVTQASKSPSSVIRKNQSVVSSLPSIGPSKQNSITVRPNISSPSVSNALLNKQLGTMNMAKTPYGKQVQSATNTSIITQNLTSAGTTLTQVQQTPQKQDRTNANVVNVDKSMQFINNVQLTKVPNKQQSRRKQNFQPPMPQTQPATRSPATTTPTQSPISSGSNSVIAKTRTGPGSTVTMMPLQNNATTVAKLLQNKHQNVVPTLVPLSSKGITPTNRIITTGSNSNSLNMRTSTTKQLPIPTSTQAITYTKTTTSPTVLPGKKSNSNVIRVGSSVVKPFQPSSPATTIKRTVVRQNTATTSNPSLLNSASMSLPNLSKLTPISPVSTPQARQQSPFANMQQPHSQNASTLSTTALTQSRQQNHIISLGGKQQNSPVNSLSTRGSVSIRPIESNKFANAGITISPGRKIPPSNQSVLINRTVTGSTGTAPPLTISGSPISNSSSGALTVSKVTTARKRPAPTAFELPENSPILVQQVKKPRMTQAAADRNIKESLMRVRASQGLTILPRNMPQANQRLSKDGKLTDVVEID